MELLEVTETMEVMGVMETMGLWVQWDMGAKLMMLMWSLHSGIETSWSCHAMLHIFMSLHPEMWRFQTCQVWISRHTKRWWNGFVQKQGLQMMQPYISLLPSTLRSVRSSTESSIFTIWMRDLASREFHNPLPGFGLTRRMLWTPWVSIHGQSCRNVFKHRPLLKWWRRFEDFSRLQEILELRACRSWSHWALWNIWETWMITRSPRWVLQSREQLERRVPMECHQWRLPRLQLFQLPQLPRLRLPQQTDKANGTGPWVPPWMSAARNAETSRPWPKWTWRSWRSWRSWPIRQIRQITRHRLRRSAIWRRRSSYPGAARCGARWSRSSARGSSACPRGISRDIMGYREIASACRYVERYIFHKWNCLQTHIENQVLYTINDDWISWDITCCFSVWWCSFCIPQHQPEDGDEFLRSPGFAGPSVAYPQHPGLLGSGASSEPGPAIGAEACWDKHGGRKSREISGFLGICLNCWSE